MSVRSAAWWCCSICLDVLAIIEGIDVANYEYFCGIVSPFIPSVFASRILKLILRGVYVYKCYIFLIYHYKMSFFFIISSIFQTYFLWYEYSHSSSLWVTVCVMCLFPFFYFQPVCVFESEVSKIALSRAFHAFWQSVSFNWKVWFTFNIFIYKVRFTSALLLFVFWILYLFCFSVPPLPPLFVLQIFCNVAFLVSFLLLYAFELLVITLGITVNILIYNSSVWINIKLISIVSKCSYVAPSLPLLLLLWYTATLSIVCPST